MKFCAIDSVDICVGVCTSGSCSNLDGGAGRKKLSDNGGVIGYRGLGSGSVYRNMTLKYRLYFRLPLRSVPVPGLEEQGLRIWIEGRD